MQQWCFHNHQVVGCLADGFTVDSTPHKAPIEAANMPQIPCLDINQAINQWCMEHLHLVMDFGVETIQNSWEISVSRCLFHGNSTIAGDSDNHGLSFCFGLNKYHPDI